MQDIRSSSIAKDLWLRMLMCAAIVAFISIIIPIRAWSSHDVEPPITDEHHGDVHGEVHEAAEIHAGHGQEVEAESPRESGVGEHHETMHDENPQGVLEHPAEGAMPVSYLIYWGVLILMMVIILVYFVYSYKRGQSGPFIAMAAFLILFGALVYIIELTPIFSGRLDPSQMRFVYEFHEGTDLGFLRFVYKIILGAFLAFFAFLNMDHKRFRHKDEEEAKT